MKNKSILFIIFLFSSFLFGKERLFDYRYNVYSQHGEDGIIKKIFEIIGVTSKTVVEFGAWDGFYLSNTANLWAHDNSWTGVLIEGDQERFSSLKSKLAGYPNCQAINAWVGIKENNKIETILEQLHLSGPIDLLSIDIDGNDYYILESLQTLRPRLLIVEYNPTIPVILDIYAAYGSENCFGASVGALKRLAEQKDYKLIALTATNAFFVSSEDYRKFEEFETDVRMLDVNEYYTYLITSQNGEFLLVNMKETSIYGIKKQFSGKLYGSFTRCAQDGLPPLR